MSIRIFSVIAALTVLTSAVAAQTVSRLEPYRATLAETRSVEAGSVRYVYRTNGATPQTLAGFARVFLRFDLDDDRAPAPHISSRGVALQRAALSTVEECAMVGTRRMPATKKNTPRTHGRTLPSWPG